MVGVACCVVFAEKQQTCLAQCKSRCCNRFKCCFLRSKHRELQPCGVARDMSCEPPFNDGASGNVAHAADQFARNCTASGIIWHLSCCQRVCLDETLWLRPQLGREAIPGALLLLLCKRKIVIAFNIKLKITVISFLGSSNITHLQHVSMISQKSWQLEKKQGQLLAICYQD